MYALHYPTSLGSVSLEALKLQQQPSIPLLPVSRKAHTVTDNLPLWEGGDSELAERLLLDKTLRVSEQHMSNRRKTRI